MPVLEDWTPEQIIAARKIHRRSGTIQEALEAMGSRMSTKSAINKLKRYGMAFRTAPSMWDGTSVEARRLKEVDHG
jgi:hypothetical protein